MLSIGQLQIPSRLVLAPMAGISDLPFRQVTRPFGCGLAYTEMISAYSLARNNRVTLKKLSATRDDRPLGVQILGGDPEIIKRALDILSGYAFDTIDFNAACPVTKVVSRREGAGLLKEPEKLQRLIGVIVRNACVSVTVKLRSGWDASSVNAVELAIRAQDAGVKGVCIHGRTRMQGYSGTVDYHIIRKVKKSLHVPVIASGDALTPVLIKKLFDETGCDGVAIARGALGNPWIFRETEHYLTVRKVPGRPGMDEIVRTMNDHLSLLIVFYGEALGVIQFRKLFAWYTRGMVAKRLRESAFRAVTRNDMLRLTAELQAGGHS